MADLLLYWRDHPPVHISVQAIVNGLGGASGKGGSTPPSRPPSRPSPGSSSPGAMESVAQMFGPPSRAFRPPCRMLPSPPVQTPEHPTTPE